MVCGRVFLYLLGLFEAFVFVFIDCTATDHFLAVDALGLQSFFALQARSVRRNRCWWQPIGALSSLLLLTLITFCRLAKEAKRQLVEHGGDAITDRISAFLFLHRWLSPIQV